MLHVGTIFSYISPCSSGHCGPFLPLEMYIGKNKIIQRDTFLANPAGLESNIRILVGPSMGLSELLELANGHQQRFGYAIFRLWDERIAAFQVGSYLKSGNFFLKPWTADGWNFRPGFGDVFAVYLCVIKCVSGLGCLLFCWTFECFFKTLPGWQKASIFGQGGFQKRCASPKPTNVKDRKARRHTASQGSFWRSSAVFPARHCPTLDPNATLWLLMF